MISFTSIIIALCIYLWWENRKEKRAAVVEKQSYEENRKQIAILFEKQQLEEEKENAKTFLHNEQVLATHGWPDLKTASSDEVRPFIDECSGDSPEFKAYLFNSNYLNRNTFSEIYPK